MMLSALDRASLHAALDEAIDGEIAVAGVVVLVEIDAYPGEIKIQALLGEKAVRLRQILKVIRKP